MKKKITMLFAALLACVGIAKADVTIKADATSSAQWTKDTWVALENVPEGVTAVEKEKYADKATSIQGYSQKLTAPAGTLYVTFKYTGGNNRIDLLGVDILDANGVVAYDYHFGYSGNNKVGNKYSVKIPAAGDYTLRYWVTFCAEENTSSGDISFAHMVNPQTLSLDKVYRLKNTGLKKGTTTAPETYLYMKASSTKGENVTLAALDESAKGQQFILEEAQNGQYLLKSANGFYVNISGWNAQSGTSNEYPMTIEQISSGVFTLHQTVSKTYPGYFGGDDYEAGKKVYVNKGEDKYIQWAFEEVASLIEVVYNFTYGGETKYTQKTKVIPGEDFPEIDNSLLPRGLAATKPTGKVTEENATQSIALTIDESLLPFVPAKDYESIKHWYYIPMHSNSNETKYIQYLKDSVYIEFNDKSVDATIKDSYTWAFIGNPFDGFKLVNYAAGKDKAVNANGTDNPYLGDYAKGVNWILAASEASNDAKHFCFKYPGSGKYGEKTYLNASSNKKKLAYWNAADHGSTMWVVERDLSGATELQALVDKAAALVEALGTGTAVGNITAQSLSAVAPAIAAAEAAIAAKEGCDVAQATLEAALAGLETIQPEANKLYTIVSSCTDDHRAGQEVYVNMDGGMQFAKTGEVVSEIARVFQFVPAANGKFYLYNIEKGVYMQSLGTATETDVTKAKPVTISNMGAANIVKIVPDGQSMMHAQDAGSKIVGWNDNSTTNGSAWKIVEAEATLADFTHTLTVSEGGWATLVLGYNTEIPAGATVYAVSGIEDSSVALAKVEGILPAHTPVLVEAAEGEYAFNYTAETATVENNLLEGSVFNVTVSKAAYILANGSKGIGLYKAKFDVSTDKTNDGTEEEPAVTYEAFVNHAGKAYLPAPAGASAAMFSFGRGEGTTGIQNSELTIQNSEFIYDLLGRRVETMTKGGIYIVNGRKVLVK